MQPLNNWELLQIWDDCLNESLLEKTLKLLSKVSNIDDWKQLGKLSIGERDARLLSLRVLLFGNKLKNVSVCPTCNKAVEWETDVKDLQLQSPHNNLTVETFRVQLNEFTIHYRLPDSYDVISTINDASTEKINQLLSFCIIDIRDSSQTKLLPEALPAEAWQTLEQCISERDPQADINMLVVCPNCSHSWEAVFDIMSFLWAEINNWAKHILQQVALLARAFGWLEKDIMAMSPQRRHLYLEMIHK